MLWIKRRVKSNLEGRVAGILQAKCTLRSVMIVAHHVLVYILWDGFTQSVSSSVMHEGIESNSVRLGTLKLNST
jgi:hypothetical protein